MRPEKRKPLKLVGDGRWSRTARRACRSHRHCEEAKPTKQSMPGVDMDRFAALAMTVRAEQADAG
jgi:hypothetical protein